MAKTIITTMKTAEGKLPYHFICNYCGQKNDRIMNITGVAIESRSRGKGTGTLEVEALRDLQEEPERIEKRIREYEEGLRAGRNYKYSFLFHDLKGNYPDYIYGIDGTCKYCGKSQAWTKSPAERTAKQKMKTSCLPVVLGFILGILCFIAAVFLPDGTDDIIGGLGFAFILSGIVLIPLLSERQLKKNLAKALAEPNDPDKLPSRVDNNRTVSVEVDNDRLTAPAKIKVVRESSFMLNGVNPVFVLNDKKIGRLSNGESLITATYAKHNILRAVDKNDFEPLVFEVESGANAEIYFKAGRFLRDKSNGIAIR